MDYASYQSQQAKLEKRRALAQMLQQQGLEGPQGAGMVSGRYVRSGIAAALAPLIQAGLGTYVGSKADKETESLNKQQSGDVDKALLAYQNSQPTDRQASLEALSSQVAPPQDRAKLLIAQAMAPKEGFSLSEGQTRYDASGAPIASIAPKAVPAPKRNVEWKDVGDKLVPVYGDTGEDVPDLKPKSKTLSPTQSLNSSPQEGDDKIANAISNFQMAPFTGLAMKNPRNQAIMMRALEMNPDYNANEYGSRSKAFKEFTSGKAGNQVRSFNVAMAHLDSLQKMSDALGNNDVPTLNQIANVFTRETGGSAPTTFEGMKKIVTDELVKSIVGAGGGVADREEAAKTISAASSPKQLAGMIEGYKTLMAGQLGGLKRQFETSTGRKDFEKFLSPAAIDYVKKHENEMGETQPLLGTAPSSPSTAAAPPVKVTSPQEAMALPPGTKFITPDGRVKVR